MCVLILLNMRSMQIEGQQRALGSAAAQLKLAHHLSQEQAADAHQALLMLQHDLQHEIHVLEVRKPICIEMYL